MTLQLYVLRQLVTGIAFAVGGMAFVAVPGIAVNAVHKLGGVGTGALLGYLPLVGMELLPYLVPIGFLLAVVTTYGRLAADNEWTAMAMAGIHPLRLLIPPAAVALLLGAGTHWVVGNETPHLKARKKTFLKNSVVETFKELSPGRTELQLGRFYLSAQIRVGDTFKDAVIHIPGAADEQAGADRTLTADEVRFRIADPWLEVEMRNARTVRGGGDLKSERVRARLALDRLFRIDRFELTSAKYKSDGEIRAALAGDELSPDERRSHVYHLHHRLAQGATYLLFLLLGAPTGLLLRKGTQLGALTAAVGYALAYYVLDLRLGRELVDLGRTGGALAAWTTTAAGAVGGALLLRRALWR